MLAERFFHLSQDPLLVVRFDGTLEDANPAMSALVGRSSGELVGLPLREIVHEDDRALVGAELGRARAIARVGFSCRVRAEDGTHRQLHLSGTPSPEDGVVLFVGRPMASSALETAALTPGSAPAAPLVCLVERLAVTLGAPHILVAKGADWPLTRVRTVAAWVNGALLPEPVEYDLAGTPCERVLRGATCALPSGLQQAFPEDGFLVDIGANSYVGVPILDGRGDVLGHVCVLDRAQLTPEQLEARTTALEAAAVEATHLLERLRTQEVLARMAGDVGAPAGLPRVRELVRMLVEATHVQYVLVSIYDGDPPENANAAVFWAGDGFREPFVYSLVNTPCNVVARSQLCRVPCQLREAFPDDPDLVPMAAESYLGVSLSDGAGRIFGQLALLDTRPMQMLEQLELTLRLFATRIGAELNQERAERVAAQTEARFRLLVEHAADALLVYDRQGTIVEVNPAALEDLRATREEIIGKNLRDLVAGSSGEALLVEVAMREAGEPLTSDAVFSRRDGTTFPAEVRTVVFEEAGRELVLSIARDVTEQRRAEQALKSALRALSTPILEVGEGVLALPLIGAVDRDRASCVMATLLEAIVRTQAEVAILDLTGVQEVDASTASHLLDIARAASLLGSRCLVSGIAPQVARTLVELGAPASDLSTFATLRAALKAGTGKRARKPG
ncbi:PAS domain S-box protein [Polyangium aurulentum]|nr:PAS domain S-box protein [Polyangium aurulentum]UQA63033.1 PAS domain S-box protein [Polyangium aurulentum]